MSKKNNTKSAKSDPNLVPLNQAMKKPTAKTAAKPRAKKSSPAKEKKMSCLDAAATVLKTAKAPMNTKAMVDAMFSAKLWTSDAPTPAATLYSAILREMQTKKSESRFKKIERGQFALKG